MARQARFHKLTTMRPYMLASLRLLSWWEALEIDTKFSEKPVVMPSGVIIEKPVVMPSGVIIEKPEVMPSGVIIEKPVAMSIGHAQWPSLLVMPSGVIMSVVMPSGVIIGSDYRL